jgi:hypothetical protein
MGKIKYHVRSKVKGKLVPVYLNYQDSQNHYWIKTEFRVKPEHWIAGKETIKPLYFDELDFSTDQKNKLLQSYQGLKTRIEKEVLIASVSGIQIDKEFLMDIIDRFFNKRIEPKKESLNQYIERYIKEITNGQRLHNHRGTYEPKRYEIGTIKNYEGFRNIWNNFQGKKKLGFEDINESVYNRFIQYCFHLPAKRGSDESGLSTNTIGRHIKNLKTIIKCARAEKLHSNIEYESFPVPREDVFNIYLSNDELEKLDKLKLDCRDGQIRDLFLIGCFSLQRFSDYSRISPEMIKTTPKGGKVIELIQVKTKTRVIIPIKPTMDVLLKKYGYQVPIIPQQEVNDRMKVIGKPSG